MSHIIFINGPGIPMVHLESGRRLSLPVLSEESQQLLVDAAAIFMVEPFSIMSVSPFLYGEDIKEWLPTDVHKRVVALVRKGSTTCVPFTVREIPTLASIADVSSVQGRIGNSPETSCVWVNPGQKNAAEQLLKKRPNVIFFQGVVGDLDFAIPRMYPGNPVFYVQTPGGKVTGSEEVFPIPEPVPTVSILQTEQARHLIFNAAPGSFRIEGTFGSLPDPASILRDSVLKLSANSDLAEAAKESFLSMNLDAVEALA